jgi:hypothetical protein
MKNILLLAAALLLAIGTASAQTTTQKWITGWDNFSEPLDLTHSNIKWSLGAGRKLTVTFTLVGATPNKLYQVGVHIFCATAPGTFGQFPTNPATGSCGQITRQGVTASVASVEMGVVTTDIHGKGSFKVTVGPIASGTYEVEFSTRNGAGCNLIGGGGNGGVICEADFQSPGPFGTATAIVVP